jgi:hypothetical protein
VGFALLGGKVAEARIRGHVMMKDESTNEGSCYVILSILSSVLCSPS